MSFQVQAAALAVAGAAAGLAFAGTRTRAWIAGRHALAQAAAPASRPYILYFTTAACSICRTHQEPALRRLGAGVDVRRVDAIAEPELARRFDVITVPTTVVVAADGSPAHVNYGFASAQRLESQLATIGA